MRTRLVVGLILCSTLAACGGGSLGSAQLPKATSRTGSTSQSVTLALKIPAASTARTTAARRAQYVSINTSSIAITINSGQPAVFNFAPNSSNCVSSDGGSRTCGATVSAPVGTDTFAVALYASSDASGTPLAQNTVSSNITAGTANTVKLALGGVVSSIQMMLATAAPPVGVAATIGLTVNLKDASGATIIGSDPFVNPVTLTDSDTSHTTAISPTTTLNSPADSTNLTVTYTGAALSQAIFGATASGMAAANVTPATLLPATQTTDPTTLVDWPTYGYDSQRSGYNPSTTAITPDSIANLHVAWQVSTSAAQSQPVVATNIGTHKALLIVGPYPTIAAYDALSGARVWQTTIGKQSIQECGDSASAGTVQYDAALGAVFVAVGNNGANPNHVILDRLDVANGTITGSVDVTPILLPGEATSAHTAVTMANGRLYLGTGSNCEGTKTGLPSWRGRVVSVDPSSMTLLSTFYTTYGQGGNYGGGGVWAWGGVSADADGNIYTASGNAEATNTVNQLPSAPFEPTTDEQAGYAEHLVKLTADLSTVEDSNYPGFNFAIGYADLDYAGTPVLFQPPPGSGCGLLSATQGKGGTLIINDTQHMTPALNTFDFSVPSGAAFYIGNPGYSPKTGYLYAAISSMGNGGSLLQPGLAAISGCGSTVAWNAQFGPDSAAYGGHAHPPRSAPTSTAGGVVFMGTPCTADGSGGCGAAGQLNGAVWAVNATTGAMLGGGKPVLVTTDQIRMAPTVDGQWLWAMDQSGNLYGLTIDPTVRGIKAQAGRRSVQTFRVSTQ